MQYLTLNETVRRLRAAGVDVHIGALRGWIRERRFQDVWVLGRHTFIYEAELDALISGQRD
ncbi:MAG: hypothetical protein ACO1SX_10970 [Actinomycetota bacterium]